MIDFSFAVLKRVTLRLLKAVKFPQHSRPALDTAWVSNDEHGDVHALVGRDNGHQGEALIKYLGARHVFSLSSIDPTVLCRRVFHYTLDQKKLRSLHLDAGVITSSDVKEERELVAYLKYDN